MARTAVRIEARKLWVGTRSHRKQGQLQRSFRSTALHPEGTGVSGGGDSEGRDQVKENAEEKVTARKSGLFDDLPTGIYPLFAPAQEKGTLCKVVRWYKELGDPVDVDSEDDLLCEVGC